MITPDVGGGFGTKLFPYREYALAAVAARSACNARSNGWRTAASISSATRRAATTSRPRSSRSTTRASSSALEVDTIADMGAYLSAYAPYIPYIGAAMLPGVYDIPVCFMPRARGLHQHRAGRCLSRRRAAGSVLCDRAAGRCRRARLGVAPDALRRKNFIRPKAMPYDDADRQGLRHRRIRGPHGARAGGRRLGRLQEAPSRDSRKAASCAASALRPISRPAAAIGPETAHVRSSKRTAASPLLDRHAVDRAGARHVLCADRRRSSRPAARQGPRGAGRHRSDRDRRRHRRIELDPGRRRLGRRARRRKLADNLKDARRRRAGSKRRAISKSPTARSGSPAPTARSASPIWRSRAATRDKLVGATMPSRRRRRPIRTARMSPRSRSTRKPARPKSSITSSSTISASRSIRCCSRARCMAARCRASARR